MEGYLLGVGSASMWARPLLIVAGLLIGFPEPKSWWQTTVIGAILAIVVVAIMLLTKSRSEEDQVEIREMGLEPWLRKCTRHHYWDEE